MNSLINLLVFGNIVITQGALVPNKTQNDARRILNGLDARGTRPYMVYFRPTNFSDPYLANSNWLCGGVIIHESYVLTSAACIEDANHFTIVSGTHRWVPYSEKDDECINKGAKRAVWKCVPKSYVFDGNEFNNIRWMIGDIAVVKVDEPFNFERRVKGCDFIPKKIGFNNQSLDFEKPGTAASIAGWGSEDAFGEETARSTTNSPTLKEASVKVMSSRICKRSWEERYHRIIDEYAICTRDSSSSMSAACAEGEVNCKELVYSDDEDKMYDENEMEAPRRKAVDEQDLVIHSAAHHDSTRRKDYSGGFCENDHGGPLIVGQGKSALVVGVMSACQTKAVTKKCFGPFLYTSVYKYRNLITCAIDKEINPTCRKLLRTSKTEMSETVYDWSKVKRSQNTFQSPATAQVSSQKPTMPQIQSQKPPLVQIEHRTPTTKETKTKTTKQVKEKKTTHTQFKKQKSITRTTNHMSTYKGFKKNI